MMSNLINAVYPLSDDNDNHKRKPTNNNEEPMLVPVNASDIHHDIQTTDDIF